MERRIQRPGFDLEEVFGCTLNVLGNRVPVSGPGKQGAKDEQVERALQQLKAGGYITTHCVDILRDFM